MSFHSLAVAALAAASIVATTGSAQAEADSAAYGFHSARDTTYAFTAVPYTHVRTERWEHNGDQIWIQDGESEGFFQLRNQASGYCLAIPHGDPEAQAVQYSCHPDWDGQWWRWVDGMSGTQLQNKVTQRVVAPAQLLPDAPIVQYFHGDPRADLTTD